MKPLQPIEPSVVSTGTKPTEFATSEPQRTPSQDAVALAPLLLAADFKGILLGTPVRIDEDCRDCD